MPGMMKQDFSAPSGSYNTLKFSHIEEAVYRKNLFK